MSLISILVVLIVVGVILYLEETYLPIAQPIKTIIRVVIVIALILWLAALFLPDIRIPTR